MTQDQATIIFYFRITFGEGRSSRVRILNVKKEPDLLIDGGSSLFASLVKLNKPNTNEYFMDLGDDDNPSKQERSPDQVIPTFVSKSIIERLTNETMKGKKVFEKEAFQIF